MANPLDSVQEKSRDIACRLPSSNSTLETESSDTYTFQLLSMGIHLSRKHGKTCERKVTSLYGGHAHIG